MNKSDRITLIERCAAALTEMKSDAEALRLTTFGIGERPIDGWGNGPSAIEWLDEQATDDQLLELAQHLGALDNGPPVNISDASSSTGVPTSDGLFVFASHLSTHRGFIGEVAEHLARYKIRLFVAHDSIPMDAAWSKEIVDALNSCRAGAVFLHPGFHESFYCQQECGWMLGRGIPLARLMIGESPQGLLGELQGAQMQGKSAAEVAEFILEWATSKPALEAHLAESLTRALTHSGSFRQTDQIWERLRQVSVLTPDQLRRVLFAGERNNQVYGAGTGGWNGEPYRNAIVRRAREWDTEAGFTARIDALADPSASGELDSPADEVERYRAELLGG